MRVTKNAEDRRNEILDVANELFNEKGYDNTSIVDILEKVGIAKGTLYYYFKSKEDIMNAIVERIILKMLAAANAIAEDSSLSVYEKILRAVMSLNIDDNKGKEIMKHIHNPQNALMHQKQLEAMISGVTPILTKIFYEGIDQGLFDTPYPYESVEMIFIYTQIAFDHQQSLSMEEFTRKIQAFIFNLERICGAKPDSFAFVTQLFN